MARRPDTKTAAAAPLQPIGVLRSLGPGLVTGAADDDPSGIATYSQVGAQFGYGLAWTMLFSFPLMASVQYICAKVGMVSGKGLAGVIRENYSRKILFPVIFGLVIANIINAGVDIGAIAAAINLLVPIPITVMIIPIALIILASIGATASGRQTAPLAV